MDMICLEGSGGTSSEMDSLPPNRDPAPLLPSRPHNESRALSNKLSLLSALLPRRLRAWARMSPPSRLLREPAHSHGSDRKHMLLLSMHGI
jgi:hypothetical protein